MDQIASIRFVSCERRGWVNKADTIIYIYIHTYTSFVKFCEISGSRFRLSIPFRVEEVKESRSSGLRVDLVLSICRGKPSRSEKTFRAAAFPVAEPPVPNDFRPFILFSKPESGEKNLPRPRSVDPSTSINPIRV